MRKIMSGLTARIQGCAPYVRRVTPLRTNPAVPQSLNAAQVKLVLQLKKIHDDDPAQAAVMFDSWESAGIFSGAQLSMISSILGLEHDDLMRTLLDCASTDDARRVVGEELMRKNL
ncbi:hypothetical protein J7E62_29160 [Variovorax paradoxus]|nr:hypothetical protein [Variovorax paradoxus]